jgi:hypothetical protein
MRIVLALLLLGCTPSDPVPADDDTAEPTPDPWTRAEPPSCDPAEPQVDPTDETVLLTSHYRLELPGVPAAERRVLALLAEAAWPAWASFFGDEPADAPLSVWLDVDQAAFEARLQAHGIPAVPEAGGWFQPGVGAFLFAQPTRYYTRVLFLHELTHQFHQGSAQQGTFPFWYAEGIAEALGRHHWDGRCLTLRVRPLLSWEDLAAFAEIDPASSCVACDVADPGFTQRPLAQEIVRFLSSSPQHRDTFRTWRDEVDAATMAADDQRLWEERFGTIDEALAAFIADDQEPMRPLWLDWLPEGPDRAQGWSPGASSAAVLKGEVQSFSGRIRWSGAGRRRIATGRGRPSCCWRAQRPGGWVGRQRPLGAPLHAGSGLRCLRSRRHGGGTGHQRAARTGVSSAHGPGTGGDRSSRHGPTACAAIGRGRDRR